MELRRYSPRILFFMISLLACLLAGVHECHAQIGQDTTLNNIVNDTLRKKRAVVDTSTPAVKMRPYQPNPKRAGLFSALVPGLGQIYNRQYWKLPIVYGGAAAAGYFFVTNIQSYQDYRKAYIGRINNPYPSDQYVGIYTTDQLQQLQNDYNRFVNLTALFTGLGYMLQVLDAITAAHLRNFDISRDISMRFAPTMTPQGPAMGLVMRFSGQNERPHFYPLTQ